MEERLRAAVGLRYVRLDDHLNPHARGVDPVPQPPHGAPHDRLDDERAIPRAVGGHQPLVGLEHLPRASKLARRNLPAIELRDGGPELALHEAKACVDPGERLIQLVRESRRDGLPLRAPVPLPLRSRVAVVHETTHDR